MSRQKVKEIELLAPAKSADIGIEAILHGADAVYIGAPKFGARAAAGNSLEEIETLVNFAHSYHARVYVAMNTILTDEQLPEAKELAWDLYKIGVDALIIQD
ncbi:MAG: peptidase U32 family protein, partial [Bacteroidales bacterium]